MRRQRAHSGSRRSTQSQSGRRAVAWPSSPADKNPVRAVPSFPRRPCRAGRSRLRPFRRNRNTRGKISGGHQRRGHRSRRRGECDKRLARLTPRANFGRGRTRTHVLLGCARGAHWIDGQQRLRLGLRSRCDLNGAHLPIWCADLGCDSTCRIQGRWGFRAQRGKLVRCQYRLRPRRLGSRDLHNIRQGRQNLGRLLRRLWLDQRLAGMIRMQRLGENCLPGMKRIGGAR